MLKKIKKIVKKILGIRIVRKTVVRINLAVLWLASSFRFTSVLYHWVFFFLFAREQHANLKGKYRYYKNLYQQTYSKTPLRRNIHRIEKALIMQPRRDSFALNYIEETVEQYTSAVEQYKYNKNSYDESELQWSHDVLRRYFDAVKATPFIEQLKEKCQQADFKPAEKQEKAPFERGKDAKPPVSYDALLDLAMRRRSVRWFQKKKVSRELIDKALLIGRQGPSACNRLPYEFKVYDDPKLVKQIAKIPFGTGGYDQNIPTIIVVVGKQENYFSARDRHLIYIDSSLAVMGFVLALETLGLGSTCINWPDFFPLENKMQKSLGLTVDERPIMLIAVGYPDPKGGIPFSQKKSLEGLRSFNEFGEGASLKK